MFNLQCEDENSYAQDVFLQNVLRRIYGQMQREDVAKTTLELYKQIKLDKELANSRIEKSAKDSLLYSNKSKIDEIIDEMRSMDINYPKSYAKLTDIKNFNAIVTNHQLKKNHVKSAFGEGKLGS